MRISTGNKISGVFNIVFIIYFVVAFYGSWSSRAELIHKFYMSIDVIIIIANAILALIHFKKGE